MQIVVPNVDSDLGLDQNAEKALQQHIKHQRDCATKVFHELDTSGNGALSRAKLKQMGIRLNQNWSDDEVDGIFLRANRNEDDEIQLGRFLSWWALHTEEEAILQELRENHPDSPLAQSPPISLSCSSHPTTDEKMQHSSQQNRREKVEERQATVEQARAEEANLSIAHSSLPSIQLGRPAKEQPQMTFAKDLSSVRSGRLSDAVNFVGNVVSDSAEWASELVNVVGASTNRAVDRVEAAAALEALCLRQPTSAHAGTDGHEVRAIVAASRLLDDALSGSAGAGHPDGNMSAAMASKALALLVCLVNCPDGILDVTLVIDLTHSISSVITQMISRAIDKRAGCPPLACTQAVRLLWRLREVSGIEALDYQANKAPEELVYKLVRVLGRWNDATGWGVAALVLADQCALDEALPDTAEVVDGHGQDVMQVIVDRVVEAFDCTLHAQIFDNTILQPGPLAVIVARMCCSDNFLKYLLRCKKDVIGMLALGLRPEPTYGDRTQRACLRALVHLGVQPHCRAGIQVHPELDVLRSRLSALEALDNQKSTLTQLAVWALESDNHWPLPSQDPSVSMQQGAFHFPTVMVAVGADDAMSEQVAARARALHSVCEEACGGLRVVDDYTFLTMCAEANGCAPSDPPPTGAAAELSHVVAVVVALHAGTKANACTRALLLSAETARIPILPVLLDPDQVVDGWLTHVLWQSTAYLHEYTACLATTPSVSGETGGGSAVDDHSATEGTAGNMVLLDYDALWRVEAILEKIIGWTPNHTNDHARSISKTVETDAEELDSLNSMVCVRQSGQRKQMLTDHVSNHVPQITSKPVEPEATRGACASIIDSDDSHIDSDTANVPVTDPITAECPEAHEAPLVPADQHSAAAVEFDMTTVRFGPGPLGIRVESNLGFTLTSAADTQQIPSNAFAVQVAGFNPLPDGSKCAAELCGRVQVGDLVAAVAGTLTDHEPYEQVISWVQSAARPLTLTFCHRAVPKLDLELSPRNLLEREDSPTSIQSRSSEASPTSSIFSTQLSTTSAPGTEFRTESHYSKTSLESNDTQASVAADGRIKKVVFHEQDLGLVLGSTDPLDWYVTPLNHCAKSGLPLVWVHATIHSKTKSTSCILRVQCLAEGC